MPRRTTETALATKQPTSDVLAPVSPVSPEVKKIAPIFGRIVMTNLNLSDFITLTQEQKDEIWQREIMARAQQYVSSLSGLHPIIRPTAGGDGLETIFPGSAAAKEIPVVITPIDTKNSKPEQHNSRKHKTALTTPQLLSLAVAARLTGDSNEGNLEVSRQSVLDQIIRSVNISTQSPFDPYRNVLKETNPKGINGVHWYAAIRGLEKIAKNLKLRDSVTMADFYVTARSRNIDPLLVEVLHRIATINHFADETLHGFVEKAVSRKKKLK